MAIRVAAAATRIGERGLSASAADDLPAAATPRQRPRTIFRTLGRAGGDAASPIDRAKGVLQTAGIGFGIGALFGGKLGWEARGAAEAAGRAKDGLVAQVEKMQTK